MLCVDIHTTLTWRITLVTFVPSPAPPHNHAWDKERLYTGMTRQELKRVLSALGFTIMADIPTPIAGIGHDTEGHVITAYEPKRSLVGYFMTIGATHEVLNTGRTYCVIEATMGSSRVRDLVHPGSCSDEVFDKLTRMYCEMSLTGEDRAGIDFMTRLRALEAEFKLVTWPNIRPDLFVFFQRQKVGRGSERFKEFYPFNRAPIWLRPYLE
jgi:hypothetical protein